MSPIDRTRLQLQAAWTTTPELAKLLGQHRCSAYRAIRSVSNYQVVFKRKRRRMAGQPFEYRILSQVFNVQPVDQQRKADGQ